MKIVVRHNEDATGPTVTYFLEVAPDATVDSLKRSIQQRCSVPPERQRITMVRLGCKVLLADGWPCSFYGLQEGSRLHLEFLRALGDSRKSQACQRYYQRLGLNSSPPSSLTQLAIRVLPTQACERSDLDSLQRCVQQSQNPVEMLSQPSARGWTCLHFAAYRGFSTAAMLILEVGVSPNVVSTDEWTPLMLACYKGKSDCAEAILRAATIDVNLCTTRGTALHICALKGRPQLCKRLLECGAVAELRDAKGRIPLEVTECVEIAELIPRFFGERRMAEIGAKPSVEAPFCGELEVMSEHSQDLARAYFVINYETKRFERYCARDQFYEGGCPVFSVSFEEITNVIMSELRYQDRLYLEMSIFWPGGRVNCLSIYPEVLMEWRGRLVVNMPCFQGPEHTSSVFTEPETPALDQSAASDKSDDNPYMNPFHGINKEIAQEIAACGFTIMEEIGQGSFGKVFKVLSRDGSHTFALKCLNKAVLRKHGQVEYAIQENRVMKKLDHPFIVKLYHSFQTPKSFYFLMEYCPNADLGTHINEREKLQEADVRFYAAEVVLALEYLHKKNIVYRDMKPENVLLDAQGHVRLADFGLAKALKGSKAVSSTFCGSPAYLAPEVLNHTGAGRPADVYSLGVLLYELAAGQPPFFSYNMQEMFRNIANKEVPIPDTMSEELGNLLRKMMDRSPDARPTLADIKKDAFFKDLKWKHVASKRMAPPRLSNFWHQVDTVEHTGPPPKSLWEGAKAYARTPSMEECVVDFE